MRRTCAPDTQPRDECCRDDEGRGVDREERADRQHRHERRRKRPPTDRECLRRSLDERVRLLDVRAFDDRGQKRAVRRSEVARRRFKQERRDDESRERQMPHEPRNADRNEHGSAREICTDHHAPPIPPVRREPSVQAEYASGHAVREPDRNDAERTAGIECEPHQGDVMQRISDLACCDREVQAAEVVSPEQSEGARRARRCRSQLVGDRRHGIGHGVILPEPRQLDSPRDRYGDADRRRSSDRGRLAGRHGRRAG